MNIKDYFESHIKCEMCTLRLKGNWETEERIDIIKKVNHIEGKYKLTVEYIEDKDETIVLYMIEYWNK